MDDKNEKVRVESPGVESPKIATFETSGIKREQGLLTSNIFHTNPSNFQKIKAAIKTDSATLGGSNLATFIF